MTAKSGFITPAQQGWAEGKAAREVSCVPQTGKPPASTKAVRPGADRGRQIVAEQDDHLVGIESGEPLGEARSVGRSAEARRGGGRRGRTAHLLVENVHRQRQEHRPGRRGARDGEGAPQRLADVLAAPHLLRPFGHRRGERDEIAREPRLGHQMARVLLPRGDDERRLARLRGDQHAHGIAEPAHRMQVDEARAPRGQRPAVRHADRRRLLQAEHVGDVGGVDERVHQRHLGRAGIAEDVGDPLVAKDVEQNVAGASGHFCRPLAQAALRVSANLNSRRALDGTLPRSLSE